MELYSYTEQRLPDRGTYLLITQNNNGGVFFGHLKVDEVPKGWHLTTIGEFLNIHGVIRAEQSIYFGMTEKGAQFIRVQATGRYFWPSWARVVLRFL